MSNLLHKVKDAVTHDKPSHSSNTAQYDPNIGNQADSRVDNSFKGTSGTTGTTTGVGGAGAGGVSSATPYKNTTTYGRPSEYDNTRSTNAGPHTSNIANQVDPRVDATRGQHGTTGVTSGGYSNPNTGLRGSNVANTTDPRVDSNRNNYGTTGGIPSGYNNPHTTNAGPHGSNVANVVDPRVDSDRSKVSTAGGVTSSGIAPGDTASGGISSGGYNVGNPHLANAEPNSASRTDPRFGSSDRNLRSGVAPAGSSYTSPGSGTTQNTAGPHNSDLLNKLDPRVDSNLDNSRTIGRDATRS
ncbi:uncharacterized protein TRUGW13939_06733 [Talaromyces rugulosus]|uniref:Period circadian protein n=1 Tax=Talaromyces rugulosus TaxID=121627 RepID=A0A7H8R0M2_TALRU|nr:uncharacterized protein TRUGW13939_06733 [Talaromyces rugulosus]QKX59596.1 hypothetical protein TRUGW13939_06733 [Talaromyces rugulosus]